MGSIIGEAASIAGLRTPELKLLVTDAVVDVRRSTLVVVGVGDDPFEESGFFTVLSFFRSSRGEADERFPGFTSRSGLLAGLTCVSDSGERHRNSSSAANDGCGRLEGASFPILLHV